jgi:hypothetical protein
MYFQLQVGIYSACDLHSCMHTEVCMQKFACMQLQYSGCSRLLRPLICGLLFGQLTAVTELTCTWSCIQLAMHIDNLSSMGLNEPPFAENLYFSHVNFLEKTFFRILSSTFEWSEPPLF